MITTAAMTSVAVSDIDPGSDMWFLPPRATQRGDALQVFENSQITN
jgi:hypothetical protein